MAPTADDWFRSGDWGASGEGAFRARLSKARGHNQAQYRRIKAHSLLATGDPAKTAGARQLLREIVEGSDSQDFEHVMALSTLGKLALDDGRIDDAEASLRTAMRLIENGTGGGSDLEEAWLAEALVARGERGDLEDARAIMERRVSSPPLILSARFQVWLTAARVAMAGGDDSAAATWARAALEVAAAEHSGLANHPGLGLPDVDQETRDWLVRVGRTA